MNPIASTSILPHPLPARPDLKPIIEPPLVPNSVEADTSKTQFIEQLDYIGFSPEPELGAPPLPTGRPPPLPSHPAPAYPIPTYRAPPTPPRPQRFHNAPSPHEPRKRKREEFDSSVDALAYDHTLQPWLNLMSEKVWSDGRSATEM